MPIQVHRGVPTAGGSVGAVIAGARVCISTGVDNPRNRLLFVRAVLVAPVQLWQWSRVCRVGPRLGAAHRVGIKKTNSLASAAGECQTPGLRRHRCSVRVAVGALRRWRHPRRPGAPIYRGAPESQRARRAHRRPNADNERTQLLGQALSPIQRQLAERTHGLGCNLLYGMRPQQRRHLGNKLAHPFRRLLMQLRDAFEQRNDGLLECGHDLGLQVAREVDPMCQPTRHLTSHQVERTLGAAVANQVFAGDEQRGHGHWHGPRIGCKERRRRSVEQLRYDASDVKARAVCDMVL